MRLSNHNLELLRNRPIQTTLDLFIFQPRVVLKCKVNNLSAAKNDRTIPFDTVSFGSYLSVEPGMTVLIGTSDGASDVGRQRLVSITSSEIKVAENSNIKWQDELYLTVIRYWDLWPVFPRIIQDPANDENVIFYKDYNIPYGNQNFYMGTFVNAGPHRPVFLDNGTGSVYYSSTGTYNLLESNLSYDWAFEGGNPTGSTSAHPGYIYYTGTGDFVTRLKVTDTLNGNIDTTYRYVSVRNRIGFGDNTPIVRWEMDTLSGSRDEGGYSAEFKVYDSGIQIDENCLVMLRAEDWYTSNNISLGGNYPNASNVFFVGYIERGSIHYNAFENYTSFTAISVTGMMKRMSGFSVSVESKQNPATWYELRDMDIRRAIYHYLRWHSTVLNVTDFSFIGTDQKIQFFDVDRTSVFDAVDNLMKSALFGRLSSDRQGRLWADIDPLAYPNPTGTFLPVMDISKRDWMGEPSITEAVYDNTSYIELGGIAYSGAVTGTFEALLSGAPGYTPSYHGSVEKISGLALSGQSQINQLSGNLWANRNQRFPTVSMNMATPARNLDIAPQEVVSIKVNREDTVRDEQIEGIFIPSSFGWTYSSKNKILIPQIEYTGVVSGDPGDTILIPPTAEEGFEFPDFSFPSFPPFYIPSLPIINPLAIDNLVVHIKNWGIYYTNDLSSVFPSWQSANNNLQSDVANFRNFEVSADGKVFVQLSSQSVWGTTAPGNPWGKIFDYTQIDNPEGYPFPRDYEISGFGINRGTGKILIIAGLVVTVGSTNILYPWYGDISGVVRTANTLILAQTNASRRGYLTYGNGKWVYTFSDAGSASRVSSATLSENGSTLVSLLTAFDDSTSTSSFVNTRSIQSSDVVLAKAGDSLGLVAARKSIDNGVTYNSITGASVPYGEGLSTDRFESIITNADGSQIVIAASSYGMGLLLSQDGGLTWSSGTQGSSGTTSVWHVGGSTYIFAGVSNIFLAEDITSPTGTPINKTGNLTNLITGAFEVIAIRHY